MLLFSLHILDGLSHFVPVLAIFSERHFKAKYGPNIVKLRLAILIKTFYTSFRDIFSSERDSVHLVLLSFGRINFSTSLVKIGNLFDFSL